MELSDLQGSLWTSGKRRPFRHESLSEAAFTASGFAYTVMSASFVHCVCAPALLEGSIASRDAL
jgi:hypothetical protein